MIRWPWTKTSANVLPTFGDKVIQKRVKNLDKQRRLFHREEKHDKEAAVSDEIATLCFEKGFYDEALSLWKTSLRIYQDRQDRVNMAEIFTKIGNTCRKQHNHREAVRYYQKSLIIDREFNQGEGVIVSLHNMGSVWLETGEYRNAEKEFCEALSIARSHQFAAWEAFTLYRLGFTQDRLFCFIDAYHSYENAVQLAESMNSSDFIAQNMIGMGDLYIHTGNYDQAIQCYKQAVMNSAKIPEIIVHAEALTRLAAINLHIGCLDEARDIARNADELIPPENTLNTRIELDLIRSEIYYARGMKENSRMLIDRILLMSEQISCLRGFIRAKIQSAVMEIDAEKYREALNIMQSIEKKEHKTSDVLLEIEQSVILGRIYCGMNQLQESMNVLSSAVKKAELSRIPKYLWLAYFNLGRIYDIQQKHQEAREAYETTDKHLRQTASNLTGSLHRKFMEHRERQVFYQFYILLLRKINHKEEARRILENVNSPALLGRVGHLFQD